MLQIFRTLFYQKTSKFNTLASIEHKKKCTRHSLSVEHLVHLNYI